MKKFITSVGLLAVGAASLEASYSPGLFSSLADSKIWSVSGTLRGFYDDNYNTAPDGAQNKKGSVGFEVTPSISLNIPLEQTQLGLRYTYGLYYYQNREDNNQNPIDQTHQLDLWVNHAFNESWQASVQDTFVSAQEPNLFVSGAGGVAVAQRVSGNNIENTGSVKLNTQWTQLLGSELGYQNTFWDYSQSGGNTVAPFNTPSYAGLLDQVDHLVWLNLTWQVLPTTVAYVGYQFGENNYTGNEVIAAAAPIIYKSDNRDSISHYVYLGAKYNPLDNLTIALKAGIQYIDFNNQPAGVPSTSSTTPYVDFSTTYTYLPGSYVQIGFTQTRNASSVVGAVTAGKITEDEESSTVYASVNHQFTPKLTGSAIGRVQYSSLQGGQFNDSSETWYSFGVNLAYQINPHISTEVGYNFDYLESSVPGQQYKRNRVYIGLTATY
jgi:hypothetical protein